MTKSKRNPKKPCGVFETVRLLEKAHILFDIKRLRPDALTITAAIVASASIDVFEDDHIEISRFRGDESIEGGSELLVKIVAAELKENYPEELPKLAAK